MALFVIIFSIFFAYLSWFRPKWALLCLIAGMPAYLIRFKIWLLPMTLLEVMILILFVAWLAKSVKSLKLKVKSLPWKWPIIAWLIVSAISVIVSPEKMAALGIWKAYFLEPILFFIVFIDLFKEKKDQEMVFYALSFSALGISVYAVIQKFTGWGIVNPFWQAEETRRVTSFFEYPNAVGLYLAPIVVLPAGYFLSMFRDLRLINRGRPTSKYKKLPVVCLFFLISCLSVAAMIFAQSEGGLFGTAIGILVLFFFSLIGKAGAEIKKAAVVSFVLIMIFLLVYPFLVLRFGDPYESVNFKNPIVAYIYKKATLKDLSGEIRQQQWRETWQMLKDGRLISGAGLAGYQEAIKSFHQEGIFYNFDNDSDFARKIVIYNEKYKAKYWQPAEIYLYPHNIILNFWSELGLAGLIVFLIITGKFFYLGFKDFNSLQTTNYKLQAGVIAAMVAIIAHGLVDVPYFKNDLSVLFWLIVGLMTVLKDDKFSKAKI